MKYIVTVDGADVPVEIDEHDSDSHFTVTIGGKAHQADLEVTARDWLHSLLVDGRSYQIAVDGDGLSVNGEDHVVDVTRDLGLGVRIAKPAAEGPVKLKPPIPGLVIAIEVNVGDAVQPGQTVLILEAMKMQMEIKAPRGGHVAEILVQPGQEVNQAQVLLVIGD